MKIIFNLKRGGGEKKKKKKEKRKKEVNSLFQNRKVFPDSQPKWNVFLLLFQ